MTRCTLKSWESPVPGFACGGLIASLIDCHSTGTASVAMYRSEGREMDSLPPFRCVTGSLQVDFTKPTPILELEIRRRMKKIKGRKVAAVQVPEDFGTPR